MTTPSSSSSSTKWKDITNELKLAAKELLSPTNPLLHVPDYNPELSLHSIELMDPRLDGGASKTSLPSITERIANNSLPLQALTSTQIIIIIDQLLQLYTSYVYGNSIPQTLFRNLYVHPTTLASLCTLVGIPVDTTTRTNNEPTTIPSSSTDIVYKHAISPKIESSILTKHLRQVYPDSNVATPGEAPVEVINILRKSIETLHCLSVGTAIHTLLTILLASCFAILNITGLSFETILIGDIQREDDFVAASYSTDLGWNLSSDNVLSLLRTAEYMLIQSNTSIDNEVNNYVGQVSANREKIGMDSTKKKNGKTGTSTKSNGNTKENTTKNRTVNSSNDRNVPIFLSLDNVVTANDVFGEGVKPDGAFYPKILTQSKYDSLSSLTSTGSAETLSSDAALLVRLRYLRYYLIIMHYLSPGNASASTPPLAWGKVFPLESIHGAAVHAWDYIQCVRLSCPFILDKSLTDEHVPGYFPLYERLFIPAHAPRVQPIPTFVNVFDLINRHLSSVTYVTQLPAFVSHNPHRPLSSLLLPTTKLRVSTCTLPLPDLTAVARSLVIDDTVPVPTIPYSGIQDEPLNIRTPSSKPSSATTTTTNITVSTVSTSALLPSSSSPSSATRSHISLHALIQLLTDFLSRDADILVRSFLRMVIIHFPTGAILGSLPDLPLPSYQEQPGVPPVTDHWKYNQVRSSVILGTHTLSEIIESSFYDVGVPVELVQSIDGQRAIEFFDSLLSSTLTFICLSPVRFRRHLEKELPEWNNTLNETEYIESLFRVYVEQRYAVLRENYLNSSMVSTGYDYTKYTAFAPQDRRFMFILQSIVTKSRPLYTWTEYFSLSFLKTYIRLGIESNIYHPDEALSVAWHLETLNKEIQRVQAYTEIGRVLHWLLPELTLCSEELITIRNNNHVPMLNRLATDDIAAKDQVVNEKNVKLEVDKQKQLQIDEETTFNYVDKALYQANGRRGTFRDKYLVATESSYYAVLIRALLGAKMGGVYSGLGVELSGLPSLVDQKSWPGLHLIINKLEKWTPDSSVTNFRHPAFMYNKRWKTFSEFERIAKSVTFVNYIGTFGTSFTVETLDGLANEAQTFVAMGVLNCTNLVNGIETLLSNGTTTVFADRLKAKEVGKKVGKGSTMDNGNKYDYESSALSSFDVLMSARDMNYAQSLVYSTDTTMRTLDIISKSSTCKALVAYRCMVSSAERAAWEAESIQARLAMKASKLTLPDELTSQDVKRYQAVATVAEKRLDKLEVSAVDNLAASNITLPPRSAMQTLFVFDLLRILEALRRDMELNYMKNQTLKDLNETADENTKKDLQRLLDELTKATEQPTPPRQPVRTAVMLALGDQKSLTRQIGVSFNSVLGVPTSNPIDNNSSTGTSNSATLSSLVKSWILSGNSEDKRGKYIITINPPSGGL